MAFRPTSRLLDPILRANSIHRRIVASSSPLTSLSACAVASSSRVLGFHTTSVHRLGEQAQPPQRSAEYFRRLAEEDQRHQQQEREIRIQNVQQPTRVDHQHPAPLTEQQLAGLPKHFGVFTYRNEQYKAVEDDLLMMTLVDQPVGSILTIDGPDVLLLGGRDATLIGRPFIPGSRITLQVEEHTHTAKVLVFKKKRRKHHKKMQGHRAEVTMVRVLSIELPEGVESLTTVTSEDGTAAKSKAGPLKPVPADPVPEPLRQLHRGQIHVEGSDASSSTPSIISLRPRKSSLNPYGLRAYSTLAARTASFLSSPIQSAFHTSASASDDGASGSATPHTNERVLNELLRRELDATTLEIEDTSGGCGAFFRLLVVSPKFTGLSLIKQHRLVNQTISQHLANLHGLTITTFTEDQWKTKQQRA